MFNDEEVLLIYWNVSMSLETSSLAFIFARLIRLNSNCLE